MRSLSRIFATGENKSYSLCRLVRMMLDFFLPNGRRKRCLTLTFFFHLDFHRILFLMLYLFHISISTVVRCSVLQNKNQNPIGSKVPLVKKSVMVPKVTWLWNFSSLKAAEYLVSFEFGVKSHLASCRFHSPDLITGEHRPYFAWDVMEILKLLGLG